MAKIHINIAVINGWEYTKGAIESIRTEHSYKVRVIDQESEDGTQDRCRDLGIDCYRKQPRVSLSEAWNFGIQESLKDPECEYILIPNNDILFHESTIDNLVEFIDESGYSMVTGDNVHPTYKSDIEKFKKMLVPMSKEFDMRPITDWREEGPDFSCPMIKRSTIEDIGWFDENFYPAYKEDWDYHLRMFLSGKHAKRITRAPYYHYGSMTVRLNPGLGLGAHRTNGVFQEKWGTPQHATIMDNRLGFKTPYNDSSKTMKYWKGCEKYHEIEKELFGKEISV